MKRTLLFKRILTVLLVIAMSVNSVPVPVLGAEKTVTEMTTQETAEEISDNSQTETEESSQAESEAQTSEQVDEVKQEQPAESITSDGDAVQGAEEKKEEKESEKAAENTVVDTEASKALEASKGTLEEPKASDVSKTPEKASGNKDSGKAEEKTTRKPATGRLKTIIRPDTAVDTYEFYVDDVKVEGQDQLVKAGDTLKKPSTPKTKESDKREFKGWRVQGASELLNFVDGKAELPSTPSGKTAHVDAVFVDVYYATFYNTDNTTVVTRLAKEQGSIVDPDSVTFTPSDPNLVLLGWAQSQGASAPETGSVTLDGDKNFYPVTGYKVTITF